MNLKRPLGQTLGYLWDDSDQITTGKDRYVQLVAKTSTSPKTQKFRLP